MVLLANCCRRTCNCINRNTHDGNEYSKYLVYRLFFFHLISESFGIRSSIATNELPRISPLGKSFVCTTRCRFISGCPD